MKNKGKLFRNIQGIILLICSISISILAFVNEKNIPIRAIVILQILGIIGILYLIFPYQIAKWNNHIHSFFNRENFDD